MRSLFIFRRDLRLEDNTALLSAVEHSDEVALCFIADPRQTSKTNEYRSANALQFMAESLLELQSEIQKHGGKLQFFQGQAEEVLESILAQNKISAVYANEDYTPFAKKRDQTLAGICEKSGVAWNQSADVLLHTPGSVRKDDDTPYTVFTPFYKKSQSRPVHTPQQLKKARFSSSLLKGATSKLIDVLKWDENPLLAVHGGRSKAIEILKGIQHYTDYANQRDIPSLDATTHLSAHHKFGTISPRETYHTVTQALGTTHTLNSELHWRDFFSHIGHFFPHVYKGSFRPVYDRIKWAGSEAHFKAWCQGLTGFPIVDAGMRELNATGYMHNRVRMVTASFLVKDLHIDWRKGERYFAQQLVDYDPAVNNGNWQWAASTGCDAQPYFRIFNPWSQQKRFDPECEYIKQWVPELAELSAKEIHNLQKSSGESLFSSYPAPIIDHSVQSAAAKEMFKRIKA